MSIIHTFTCILLILTFSEAFRHYKQFRKCENNEILVEFNDNSINHVSKISYRHNVSVDTGFEKSPRVIGIMLTNETRLGVQNQADKRGEEHQVVEWCNYGKYECSAAVSYIVQCNTSTHNKSNGTTVFEGESMNDTKSESHSGVNRSDSNDVNHCIVNLQQLFTARALLLQFDRDLESHEIHVFDVSPPAPGYRDYNNNDDYNIANNSTESRSKAVLPLIVNINNTESENERGPLYNITECRQNIELGRLIEEDQIRELQEQQYQNNQDLVMLDQQRKKKIKKDMDWNYDRELNMELFNKKDDISNENVMEKRVKLGQGMMKEVNIDEVLDKELKEIYGSDISKKEYQNGNKLTERGTDDNMEYNSELNNLNLNKNIGIYSKNKYQKSIRKFKKDESITMEELKILKEEIIKSKSQYVEDINSVNETDDAMQKHPETAHRKQRKRRDVYYNNEASNKGDSLSMPNQTSLADDDDDLDPNERTARNAKVHKPDRDEDILASTNNPISLIFAIYVAAFIAVVMVMASIMVSCKQTHWHSINVAQRNIREINGDPTPGDRRRSTQKANGIKEEKVFVTDSGKVKKLPEEPKKDASLEEGSEEGSSSEEDKPRRWKLHRHERLVYRPSKVTRRRFKSSISKLSKNTQDTLDGLITEVNRGKNSRRSTAEMNTVSKAAHIGSFGSTFPIGINHPRSMQSVHPLSISSGHPLSLASVHPISIGSLNPAIIPAGVHTSGQQFKHPILHPYHPQYIVSQQSMAEGAAIPPTLPPSMHVPLVQTSANRSRSSEPLAQSQLLQSAIVKHPTVTDYS